jgi:MFS family permease
MDGFDEYRHLVVFCGCFCAAVGFFAYLLAPASILSLLVAEYAVDSSTASLAISAVFLAWVVFQLPGGVLVDRYDNRLLVAGAGGLLVLAGVAGIAVSSFEALLVTRFVGGVTAVFLWTAGVNVVASTFPASRRAVGVSLFTASAPAGAALALFCSPLLAAATSTSLTFAAYPLLTMVGVVVALAALEGNVQSESRLSLGQFGRVIRHRAILLASLGSFCAYALFVFFNSWLPTYVIERFAVDLATAGALAALVPLSGLVARPGGGLVAERPGGRLRAVIVAAFAIALTALVGLQVLASLSLLPSVLLLAGIGSQLGMGALLVSVTRHTGPETRGTAVALLTTMSMTGALVAPPAGGLLIDTVSWSAAFLACGLLAVVGIVAVLAVPSPASRTSK